MNKKNLAILAAISGISLSSAAFAAENNSGGFTGPTIEVITVDQAKNMEDDTFVILRGNVKQSLGDDMYVFADSTGTINIDIDEEDWNGAKVTPEDVVEIRGEVDTHWRKPTSIDVDTVTFFANKSN